MVGPMDLAFGMEVGLGPNMLIFDKSRGKVKCHILGNHKFFLDVRTKVSPEGKLPAHFFLGMSLKVLNRSHLCENVSYLYPRKVTNREFSFGVVPAPALFGRRRSV